MGEDQFMLEIGPMAMQLGRIRKYVKIFHLSICSIWFEFVRKSNFIKEK